MTLQEAVVATARAEIGKQYQWGGEDNPGFDCSGLCQWAYAQNGVTIPRTSQEQAQAGIPVAYSDLQPGDLIIIYPDASHVALYSGDGNVIQASTYGVPVEEVPITQAGPFNQARRYIQENTVTLYGVDVSNNNWGSTAACQNFIASLPSQGYSWVEAKVSEGDYYRDPYWSATKTACDKAGIPVVGYHYAIAADDPADQVQTFLSNGGGSTVMIDFEANSGNINDFWNLVNAFNDAGVQVVLSYIPRWYWEGIGSPDLSQVPGLISSSYFESGTFGSVEYNDAGGDSGPGWEAYGNASPVIWQFTDGDIVDGFSVDGNAFKGSQEQLAALLAGSPSTGGTVTQPIDPASDNQIQLRGPNLQGWPQLAGHTVVDALAAIGQKLGIEGFTTPGETS